MKADLVIKNVNVFAEGGLVEASGVAVKNGKIIAIAKEEFLPESERVVDGKGKTLLPGGIDPHVHFRDPSYSERETFYSGSMAAAAGGITTVCEHPISLPPPYSPELLHRRVQIAKDQSVVDFAFFGAAGADKIDQIPLISREPIIAFKTFFHEPPEGRDKEFEGLTMAKDPDIYEGFKAIAKSGKILAVHAENNDMISSNIKKFRAEGKIAGRDHSLSRPPITEIEAVSKVLCFAKELGTRVLLCHISTPEAAELVKQAKASGMDVYLETCPHYLFLSIEDLDKHGAFAKCNPPLREKALSDALWSYIADGSVDIIGSDHSPFLTSEKEKSKDIFAAPAGFPGIDLRMSLMLTAVKQGKLSLARAVDLLSTKPAKVYGLYPRKGAIKVGADADLILVDLDAEFTVDRSVSYSKARDIGRVYEGWKLNGKMLMTTVRGRIVMENGVVDEAAKGWGNFAQPVA